MSSQQQPAPRVPMHGAVDLSALKARATRPAPPNRPTAAGGGSGSALGVTASHQSGPGAPADGGGDFVIEVTEASFEADVLGTSMQVPVVIDFWADWCEPCKQLTPVLERLAGEYGGRFVLATIDVEANQRIAQAIGVQSLPTVIAVVGQQPVPLFQGALPEDQVRQVLDELLKVAVANGITGRVAPREAAEQDGDEEADGAPQVRHPEALEALARNDLDAAEAAYTEALGAQPNDPEAEQGLARVGLLRRVYAADPAKVRAAAADAPTDVAAQCLAADLDAVGGDVEGAFTRLIDTVRVTAGEDRETAREHLLTLFLVAGPGDPRVAAARRALASALF